jgi:pyruvate,orthophosphate dikinase
MRRFVYSIGDPEIAALPDARALLGGKGLSLAAMAGLGVPVPPAFVVTTEAFHHWRATGRLDFLDREVAEALARLESSAGRGFGEAGRPLLVSVRSGAAVSMPGMMDTILNIGACDKVLPGLSDYLGAAGAGVFARLQADYARIVGLPLPADPQAQLRGAIERVFLSWDTERAKTYRRRADIADDLGTAVTVQAMVFGVAPGFSGTGVLFTRDPATGERRLMGDWLHNAQGEDVVSGSHQTDPVEDLATSNPPLWQELCAIAARLEQHQQDMCDIEFTVECGRLWVLQFRSGKRSPLAAVRIAVDMAQDEAFALTRDTALGRVASDQIASLYTQRQSVAGSHALGKGLAVCAGTVSGRAALSTDAALDMTAEGEKVILVRPETSPDDIPGMDVAEGILTSTGGLVSHAAIVAREWRKPAIVGLSELTFDAEGAAIGGARIAQGDVITINGATGEVFLGEIATSAHAVHQDVEKLIEWARNVAGDDEAEPAALLRAAQAKLGRSKESEA